MIQFSVAVFGQTPSPPLPTLAAVCTKPNKSAKLLTVIRKSIRRHSLAFAGNRGGLCEAAVAVYAERLQSWKNGKHQVQWLASLEIDVFPFIGNTPVNDVDGPAVREVLAKIWLAKPETARRVRQRVGAIIDWSCAKGYRAPEIPMRSLSMTLPRQPKKKGHFEAMPYADVPAFLAAVRERRQSMGRFALETLILTATRSDEIRGARWGEIDLKAATWTVPGERMKAGVKHVVPLSDPVRAILEHAASFCYLIGPDGTPFRLGVTLANEFSDHVTERHSYLWPAHSKLRQAALGPELLVGPPPSHVTGTTASSAMARRSGKNHF